MITRAFRTKAFAIKCAEAGKAPEKIQLFRTGTFHHSEYGQFEITKQTLAEMVKNFELNVRGVDLAIDYKHENDDVAAGWIRGLELAAAGDELWATVEWTPKGAQVLADKEFRYMSPEFAFEYQDNETLKKFGPTLFGGGLTNRPTIKNMEPVVELQEGAPVAPKPQTKKPEGVKSMDYKTMDDAAVDAMSPEDMKKACKEMLAEIKKASAAVAQAAEEKKMAEKKQKFAVLLSEGKVVKAQEESYLKDDMAKFLELASAKKLNESESGSGAAAVTTTTVVADTSDKAQDEILKAAHKMLAEKKIGSMAEAIKLALKENAELNKKIYG